MRENIRLYLEQPLAKEQAITLSDAQAHYLFSVMRLALGESLRVFNGRDGEWRAVVEGAGKRSGRLRCTVRTANQGAPADVWLIFSPIKKERTHFIVEKATELGAARLIPTLMRRSNGEKWRESKHRAHMIEAAEQCGATYIPQLDSIISLPQLLAQWPQERLLFWADESLARTGLTPPITPARISPAPNDIAPVDSTPTDAAQAGVTPETTAQAAERTRLELTRSALAPMGKEVGENPRALGVLAPTNTPPEPAAIIIGPEGGFAPEEQNLLRACPRIRPLYLGPQILRSETAALAALTLWHAHFGSWASAR